MKKPKKKNRSSQGDLSAAEKASPGFEAFEAGMKEIIKVPKTEIDRREAEFKERSSRKTGA